MVSYRDFPSKSYLKVFLPIAAGHSTGYISHATNFIIYILSNRVSDSRNIPSLKLSAIFWRVLSVIFRYTVGTHVSFVVASLDFTGKSPDYVLSKTGLFSTKLSLSIVA